MKDFDRMFNMSMKFIIGWFIFCAIAGIAIISFIVWLIIVLLSNFGVI